MVQGQVFIKGGAGTLSFLHLEIILLFAKLCLHLKKNYFFCHHNSIKKVILSSKFQKRGGGVKNFWIKGGAFPERGGGGFLDIIFHPFQILFLVSLNR